MNHIHFPLFYLLIVLTLILSKLFRFLPSVQSLNGKISADSPEESSPPPPPPAMLGATSFGAASSSAATRLPKLWARIEEMNLEIQDLTFNRGSYLKRKFGPKHDDDDDDDDNDDAAKKLISAESVAISVNRV